MSSFFDRSSFPTPEFLIDVPLIILHPNASRVQQQLPNLLSYFPKHLQQIFVSVERPDTSAAEFRTLLIRAVRDQTGLTLHTGDQTVLQNTPQTEAREARHDLTVLAELGPFCLVIDAFDYLRELEICTWLSAFIPHMPAGNYIVLNSRHLPELILAESTLRTKISLFPIDEDEMLIDYTQRTAERVLVEVYELGVGRALINGSPVMQWDGMLPYTLFFYLIDRGMTTRDDIFQTFWPNLTIREATNVFHVTKRKINELLGFDLMTYWAGFYRISPQIDLHYDVVKFAEAVQNSAVADDDAAIAMLRKAIYLYRGDFLSGIEGSWITARRAELRSLYVEALAALAHLYEQRNARNEALGLYNRALLIHPQRKDLARSVLSLHQAVSPAHAK